MGYSGYPVVFHAWLLSGVPRQDWGLAKYNKKISIWLSSTKKYFDVCGAWLAQSVEHAILNLRVLSSSSTLGVEPT